ncbi:MAG: carbohydrate ABC transporter permease [Clostridiales bacterium]|nr:carbohydrate ABC transporter permease [Clostridiales bacterium]MBR5358249.1 carbohydrate ABC transporter permease [Clostridiales bacterium]
MATENKLHKESVGFKIFEYVICVIFAILSLAPFYIMFVNATRGTYEIQQHAISLISPHPFQNLAKNWAVFNGKDFHPETGFVNSFIISTSVTILALYFSSLTAYSIQAYEWKGKKILNGLIMGIMMIPGTVTMIGFYQMVYKIHMTNRLEMLIIPAIASPMMVYFMKQYLQGSLSLSIVESARIDGASEFRTFNQIVLPLMKPAIATQAIFTYVSSWNNLFIPLILLTDKSKYTLPIVVSLLKGDIYKTEYGSVYLGLSITVLPLIVVYIFLSKYIVEGVALGGTKG